MGINELKNKLKQISNNDSEILDEYPYDIDAVSKKRYRRAWVSSVFVDIVNYQKLCDENDDRKIARFISLFSEGIIGLIDLYGIKHSDIQGDGIFALMHAPKKESGSNIFELSKHIYGFLEYFLPEISGISFDYRIHINDNEEIFSVVGSKKNDNKKIVFSGKCISESKNITERENFPRNKIVISNLYKINQEETLDGFIQKEDDYWVSYYYKSVWED